MNKMYGIKNCDTIKKAKKWLENNQVDYKFHDYRVDGLNESLLNEFISQLDWELLVNKRGTTYRQLPQQQKDNLSKDNVVSLLLEFPAMIKRPLTVCNNHYYLGFKPEQYQEIFNK